MALFKGNQKNEKVQTPSNNTPKTKATFVSQDLEVTGDFKGTGSVLIEGILHGNITVNSIVIGENAVVNGSLNAKSIIINGKLNGNIICDSLEIMKKGYVSNNITVKKVLISGRSDGEINAENEISIHHEGSVKSSKMRSKRISIDGSFNGNLIASELLTIGPKGSVKGETMVKNIKIHEGGKILGSINTYIEVKEKIQQKEFKKHQRSQRTSK